MNEYTALAGSYDRLTYDVEYAEIWAFLKELLSRAGKTPETVLDLACGTGSMSVLLAQEGYRVIGVDMSEDMLTVAAQKAQELENMPFFVCQRMERLRLPYPVDCAVCCLDSLNYVTDPADCRKAIARVWKALRPGGMFLFDVNSPEKLRDLDGQVFLDEDDDVYCVWRAEFDEDENICYYGIDLFRRQGSVWHRSFEEHREYAYTVPELTAYLGEAGFTDVRVYGDRKFSPPETGEQRIFITAVKE